MIQFPASGKLIRKFIYCTIAAIFGWATWRRFSLPLDPIADLDTWGYLSPALLKLTGGEFVHALGRNFVYPGFLLLLLRVFGDFRALGIVQHLLGLAGGGLILMTWQRVRTFITPSPVADPAHTVLGLILVAVFLLAGEPMRAEMQIRPEGICAFVLSLNLYFVIGFIARAFVLKDKPPVALGAAIGGTAMLLASLKPSLVFLAAVALFPVGVFFFQRNHLRQKCVLGLALLISAIIFFVPEYLLSGEDEFGQVFLPTTLFTIHADLIRDQMAEDVRSGAALPYKRDLLDRIQKQLALEIEKSAAAEGSRFPSLGFSPDYLMYAADSIADRVALEFNYDNAAITSFYRFCYWRAWQERPLGMLRKIGHQIALFYAPVSPVYDRRKEIPLAIVYKTGAASFDYPSMHEVFNAYPPGLELIRRNALLGENAAPIEQSRLVRSGVAFLARAYLPLLALTLVMSATCLRTDVRKAIGWLTALTLLVFAYNFAACLEVAILQVFDGPRYSTVQFCFTLLAEFLALRLVLEGLLQLIRWGRPIQTSAPGE
ncbi:MAG: hypothetical protein ABR611_01540 [Chthoniobacterales bacterium]